jgi:hypothetical protein
MLSGWGIGHGRVSFIRARRNIEIALFERRIVSVGQRSGSKAPPYRNKPPRQAASCLLKPSHISAY